MSKKVFKFEDFFTKTRNEAASKMPLLMDNADTGCYFMVKGMEARSVARQRLNAQVAYAALAEEAESIADKANKIEFDRLGTESIQIELAKTLIVGWSFHAECDDDGISKILEENQGLSSHVIAHAMTSEMYFAKK